MKTLILIPTLFATGAVLLWILRDLIVGIIREEDGAAADSRSLEPPERVPKPRWTCSWCGRAFGLDHRPFCAPEGCECHSHGICCECAVRLEREENLPAGALTTHH